MVSTGLTLIAMDIALRVFSVGTPRRGTLVPKPERHPLTPWIDVFPPGYSGTLTSKDFKVGLRMNSLGLRERELDFDVLASQRPYLFLGDSYFIGWGVDLEDRLSERFAALVRQDEPPGLVVNLSFPGWGTYHYVEVWEHFVPRLRPRLVVVSCFVGNDFTDDLKQASRRKSGDAGNGRGGMFYLLGLKIREALSTSPLLGLLDHALWKFAWFRGVFNRLEIRNDRIVLYEPKSSELQRQLYASTELGLAALTRLSRDSGVPLLVVLIPDHLQVLMPELFRGLDFDRPQRDIKEYLKRQGVACFDLLPVFREAGAPERFFFREDKHWNAHGHAFVAKALLPVVREIMHRSSGNSSSRLPEQNFVGDNPVVLALRGVLLMAATLHHDPPSVQLKKVGCQVNDGIGPRPFQRQTAFSLARKPSTSTSKTVIPGNNFTNSTGNDM